MDHATELTPDACHRLFAPLARYGTLVLAVSGGPDSMTLMHLVARWAAALGPAAPQVLVATVDHRLRSNSDTEAAWVGAEATGIGLTHRVLAWDGPKPASGLQDAARAARYQRLADLARELGPSAAIVTAHHRDDQIETFLMRLARGSGLDGLSAMARHVRRHDLGGVAIERPLLDVPKSVLLATLMGLGARWVDDPSNDNDAFERVRVRRLRQSVKDAGIGDVLLARSLSRLHRAREALDQATTELWSRAVTCHDGCYGRIDRPQFLAAPEEIRVRLLARTIAAFGGGQAPVRLSAVEDLADRLAAVSQPKPATIGGCFVTSRESVIDIFRESRRNGLPAVALGPGESRLWDGRFVVQRADFRSEPLHVRAVGVDGYATLGRDRLRSAALPRRAVLTLPSFWQDGYLVAVPHLGYLSAPNGDREPLGQSFRCHVQCAITVR